jgi:hypothetical protein
MSGVLPASPAARRAELEARERARTEAFDRGYAQGRAYGDSITGQGAAFVAAPTAPQSEPSVADATEIDPLDIEDLADILTAGRAQIEVPHSFSFTARRDAPPTVTAVNFGVLGRYTIEEVLRLKLLSGSGILNRSVYGRLIEERDGRSGRWLSTMDPRAKLNVVGRVLPKD